MGLCRNDARRAEGAADDDAVHGWGQAFVRAGDVDSVVPIRMFYRQWGVVVEIERHPGTARRLHAAEQAISRPDPDVRERAVREAGEIVRAAHREVAGG